MSLTRPAQSVKVDRWGQSVGTGGTAHRRRRGQWTAFVSRIARRVVQGGSTTVALLEDIDGGGSLGTANRGVIVLVLRAALASLVVEWPAGGDPASISLNSAGTRGAKED